MCTYCNKQLCRNPQQLSRGFFVLPQQSLFCLHWHCFIIHIPFHSLQISFRSVMMYLTFITCKNIYQKFISIYWMVIQKLWEISALTAFWFTHLTFTGPIKLTLYDCLHNFLNLWQSNFIGYYLLAVFNKVLNFYNYFRHTT